MDQNTYLTQYETALAEPRRLFAEAIMPFLKERDPRRLMIFWLNFSTWGVEMTASVEDWIRRAGEKTEKLGYAVLGKKLAKHAVHEKNHHFMMIKDAKKLVDRWNKAYKPLLDAEVLLKRETIKSVLAYQALHEDCIASDFPFAQIAIEYEIENLSIVHGPVATGNMLNIFGEAIQSDLTFIFDHVVLDEVHTNYNRAALVEFLNESPNCLEKLIEMGSLALKTYGNFMKDCYQSMELLTLNTMSVA